MDCTKFCEKPINTNYGLMARGLDISCFKNKSVHYNFDLAMYTCPFGFKHNPKTKKATINLIRNGGRTKICHNNPWKYEQL